jgi:lipid A 3-O-deacylase
MKPGRALIVILAWLLGTSSAHAVSTVMSPVDDRPGWQPDATFAQVGNGSSTDEWTIGAQWDWRRQWEIGETLRVRGRWDLEFGRLRALTHWDNDDHAWYTKIAFMPVLRLSSDRHPWYVDAGVGPALVFPMYVSRERTFSTTFNFDDYVAVGVQLGSRNQHDLSIGFNHISNAGLSEPNPGLNLYAARYTHRF